MSDLDDRASVPSDASDEGARAALDEAWDADAGETAPLARKVPRSPPTAARRVQGLDTARAPPPPPAKRPHGATPPGPPPGSGAGRPLSVVRGVVSKAPPPPPPPKSSSRAGSTSGVDAGARLDSGVGAELSSAAGKLLVGGEPDAELGVLDGGDQDDIEDEAPLRAPQNIVSRMDGILGLALLPIWAITIVTVAAERWHVSCDAVLCLGSCCVGNFVTEARRQVDPMLLPARYNTDSEAHFHYFHPLRRRPSAIAQEVTEEQVAALAGSAAEQAAEAVTDTNDKDMMRVHPDLEMPRVTNNRICGRCVRSCVVMHAFFYFAWSLTGLVWLLSSTSCSTTSPLLYWTGVIDVFPFVVMLGYCVWDCCTL